MDHYLDIQIVPDPELSAHVAMSGVFGHLHRALAASGREDIGVSFPQAGKTGLGAVLRLHGTGEALVAMDPAKWLHGARDYVRWEAPAAVPAQARYCEVRRIQVKSSPERLRRRQMKRHGWTAEQALDRIPDSVARTSSDPYLKLSSRSTGQSFRLFIRHGPPVAQARTGVFNSYGLSQTATVPWF